jgi:hypothetical protein
MSHDKIKAAARRRMRMTGETYAAARREVIREHRQAAGQDAGPGEQWFAISFSGAGSDRVTAWMDALFGGGPGRSGVAVHAGEIRLRMGDFRFTVPRGSIRSVARSREPLRGTTGVHLRRGRLLVNGSAEGLVEVVIEPPCRTGRSLSTVFVRQSVSSLVISLDDPDAFIAAVEGAGRS